MTKDEWLREISRNWSDVNHIIGLLDEIPFTPTYVQVTKVLNDGEFGVKEWEKRVKDAQELAGVVFEQCELFGKRIVSFQYYDALDLLSVILED